MQKKEINNNKALENLSKLITIIPKESTKLLADLNSIDKNGEDVRHEVMGVLEQHMFLPEEDWEFEAISITSGISSENLKSMFKLAKIKAAIDVKLHKMAKS